MIYYHNDINQILYLAFPINLGSNRDNTPLHMQFVLYNLEYYPTDRDLWYSSESKLKIIPLFPVQQIIRFVKV